MLSAVLNDIPLNNNFTGPFLALILRKCRNVLYMTLLEKKQELSDLLLWDSRRGTRRVGCLNLR